MKVLEIFNSIQGEGRNAGLPTTFIRLAGCNLKCSYCDSQDIMQKKPMEVSVNDVLNTALLKGKNIRNVCITGGEPLLQVEVFPLVRELLTFKNVEIETNGSILIDHFDFVCLGSHRPRFIMDIKAPSSGYVSKNDYRNISYLSTRDDVVFVIKNWTDFMFAVDIMKKHNIVAQVYFSQCMIEGEEHFNILPMSILDNVAAMPQLADVKVQVQLHKILNMK
jgi:7-carboxy-7-deazaguanine synthase